MGIIKKFNKKLNKAWLGVSPKVQVLHDEEMDLEWVQVTSENLDQFESEFAQIGTWSDNKNIQRFITSKTKLDELFRSFVEHDGKANDITTFCLCKSNNNLIGFIYVTVPIGDNDYSSIDYIVVNPNIHGKGVGSRMVSSIKSHLEYFNHGVTPGCIVTSVEEENVLSNKMFQKNGFKPISSHYSSSGRKYIAYYCSPREKTM